MKSILFAFAAMTVLGTGAVWAQQETIENMASAEEIAKVNETIGKIGCKAVEVEKESENLYELDDTICEIGQYDIKLDGNFAIISMTRDE